MSIYKRRIQWFAITLAALTVCCPAAWSKTLTVGKPNTPCPSADYSTITDAINAAQSSDVIKICPALYPEQLLITKPLTLAGISVEGVDRVLIQPTSLIPLGGLGSIAVISVVNTSNVTISNLAIDAGNNTVSGCSVSLAGIHFYNASGVVDGDAIFGARLSNPLSCTVLFPGNGFGVQADQSAGLLTSFKITVQNSSIHDFGRNGILVTGSSEKADINGNSITGIGPIAGVNQFGVFLANGATGRVTGNNITQASCRAIPILNCFALRSEGVVLRAVGDGVRVAGNVINNVQAGVFVNGATNVQVMDNVISNVDALNAIHIQQSVSGSFVGNRIFHVGPITMDASATEAGCGLNDLSGVGNSGNHIIANSVNDAYCGVAYVTGDRVEANVFMNTLYETLNGDDYPSAFPPALEPGQ